MEQTTAKKNKYEIDMCNGTIMDKLISFSLPLMLSGILQLMFNAVDIIVVGRFSGSQALAAVGSTSALINVFTNLFIGISLGANVLTARFYAAGREKEVSETVHTAITLALVSGIVMALVGLVFSKGALALMGTPDDVIGLSALYMRIYFLGMPFFMLYNYGAAILRAVGDTKRPLLFLMIAGVINACLNMVLVIVFKLGVAGVAIATVISQMISCVLVLRCLCRSESSYRLRFSELGMKGYYLKQIFSVGVPAGIQSTVINFSNVLLQSSVNSFGSTAMAGYTAANNLLGFLYVSVNSITQACMSFTSQNYGAGDYRRIKKIAMISVVTGVVTTELLSVLAVYLGPQLLGIYSPSAEVVAAGMVRLRWIALFYGLDAIMDVIVGSLRGVGYNILPMLVTLMGACASRLIWLSTVFRLPAYHRIEMVYIVYPLSWALTATTHLICYFFVSRKVDRELRAHEAELAARMEESPEEADS